MWRRWRDDRVRRDRATAVARAALAEPDTSDVTWLAERGAHGDEDHARWEWRYARRAFTVIVAQRDALDDLTGSLVAAGIAQILARDPLIDSPKRAIATRQFNDRLSGYAAILRDRDPSSPTAERLARALLAFAGNGAPTDVDLNRGAAALSAILADTHATLAHHFGSAELPPDVVPSEIAAGRRV